MWILIECKASNRVHEVISYVKANHITQDEFTASAIIASYRDQNMHYEAFRYYQSLCSPQSAVKPNCSILSAVLQSLYTTGDLTMGLRLIIEAESIGIIPDASIFTVFLRACVINRQDKLAVKIFKAIRSSKPMIQCIEIYNKTMKQPSAKEILINESTNVRSILPDHSTYSIMMEMARKNSNSVLAVYIAKDMLKNPDVRASLSKRNLIIAIDLCVKDHKFSDALDIIESVKKNRKSSNIFILMFTILCAPIS
jgi:hypothetical protein